MKTLLWKTVAVGLSLVVLSCLSAGAQTPEAARPLMPRLRRQLRVLRRAAHPRALRTTQDPAALQLLRAMVRPSANYAGEQITQVVESGRSSRQTIKGDTQGRTRLDFLEPNDLRGDVLLIAPNQFHNYHHASNTLDVALWPTGRQDVAKRIPGLIKNGLVSVSRVGSEQIAGRNAAIIEIAPGGMPNGAERIHLKYWIDMETGVQLKNERFNASGLVSQSYLTRVTIGPEANVAPRDFNANFPNARVNPILPGGQAGYNSVADVQPFLPFKPFQPATLPAGFRLAGVWLFQPDKKNNARSSVLLHYTNGLNTFSLFERARKTPANAPPAPARAARLQRRSIQRWLLATPAGTLEVTYIGSLSAAEVQALHDSLR